MEKDITLIAGLGNPGENYRDTRHNIGFAVLDELARGRSFPPFKEEKKFQAELSRGLVAGKDVLLAKPLSFMNRSGPPLAALCTFYKIPPERLWVVHDEADLPLGLLRIGKGKGPAGHKGISSLIEALGTNNFVRFRVGIGKEGNLERHVLERFSPEEKEEAERAVTLATKAMETALSEGIERAMNAFHQKKDPGVSEGSSSS